jgi:molecular chaperone GrpE
MPDQKRDPNPDLEVGSEQPPVDPQTAAASVDAGADFVDQQSAAGARAEAGGGDVAALTAALESAKRQADEFKDQALRARAEAENVRKRSQREAENAQKYALEKFVAELLPVLDSLERAVDSCRAQSDSEAAAAIAEGVELSLKMFLEALQRHGVRQLDPHGEPFNPQHHEAMSMLESATAEPGSVVQVLQKGYLLNDRLVRAAMVMVAKAPADGS